MKNKNVVLQITPFLNQFSSRFKDEYDSFPKNREQKCC